MLRARRDCTVNCAVWIRLKARAFNGRRNVLIFPRTTTSALPIHPLLKEAAVRAVKNRRRFGRVAVDLRFTGASSRLERGACLLKKTGAALAFSSGYATAIGTIWRAARQDDIIVLEQTCSRLCRGCRARLCGQNCASSP